MAYACGVIIYNRSMFNPVMVIMCFQNIEKLRHTLAGMLHSSGGMKEQMETMQKIFNMDEIPQEKATSKISAEDVPKQWPQAGKIEFKNIELSYRPTTEKVLKGLTFEIKGGNKIGVVGRTGAGKSTLSLALTRIVETSAGSIKIDGINIQDIPLSKLRENITMIPQDPTLFTGSLRYNLDPAGKADDESMIKLLKETGLDSLMSRQVSEKKDEDESKDKKDTDEDKDNKHKSELDYKIEEGGKNLSSGEKQLLCICRAILRKNKIVLLDEATSNIDITTEKKIQSLIEKNFTDCTMITIAHRL